MKRKRVFVAALIVCISAAAFAVCKPASTPIVARLTRQHRPAPKMPTITTLPAYSGIPLYASLWSKGKQDEVIQSLVNSKLSTWPATSSRGHRAGKFTSTGIFGGFPPTEAQISRVAPHYDNILLGAGRWELIPRFKRHNPELTLLVYVDSGLSPGFKQVDAGSVDHEDTDWILRNHPDWILKDGDGNFIRSGSGGLSNPGQYWPDPGNREWQNYCGDKIAKLLRETGGQWDGVLLDQFVGTAEGHVRYARSVPQANYPTDETYQAACLDFLRVVRARIGVPIIANMVGESIIKRPGFVAEVANAAGGAENEVFPEEMPSEDLRPYLETVERLPATLHIRINSKPAGLPGDVDRTLFAYYCYLLIADRNREVYWTYKEGTSDVPHYWYREFDLDLGAPKGRIHFGAAIWSRAFEKAVVVVNAEAAPAEYTWESASRFHDVTGRALRSPITLQGRTAMLLMSNPSILPK